jgi:membrane protein
LLASVVSAASLIFAASGAFYVMKDSLNIIWKVKAVPNNGLVKFAIDRLRSLGVVLSIGFILLVSLVLNGLISAFATYFKGMLPNVVPYVLLAANFLVSLLITTVLFAIIFKTLPDVRNKWSDVWVGALVTALLFALGRWLIGVYIGQADVGSTYGAAGAIVVILVWVYYASQILFLGAEFTYVYSRRFGSGIQPSDHAVRVVKREVELNEQGRRISATERSDR